jgi:Domain of unknown function (DUF4352)
MAFAFCPKCGTQRVGDSRYCRACGLGFEKIANADSVAGPSPAAAPLSPGTFVPSAAPQWAGPAPARAKRHWNPAIGFMALAAIVVVVFLAQNSGSPIHPAPSGIGNQAPAAISETPSPAVTPTLTAPPWLMPGEPVAVTGGSGDSAVGAGVFRKMGATCGYATAGVGNMFVAVGVLYVAGRDRLFYSPAEWTAHDETDEQYEPSFSCLMDPSLLLSVGTLNPGLHASGIVVFEIPADATHLYVDWRATVSGQTATWRLWYGT